MKLLLLCRLIQYVITFHFLSHIFIFLMLDMSGVSAKSDLKTKLLLKNIRTHLAQKVDEIVKKKECESGLILCKNPKSKEVEGEEEKSEEIPLSPKIFRGQHKPVVRVNPKDVIQSFMTKEHKSFHKKPQKLTEDDKVKKLFQHPPDTQKLSGKDREPDKGKKLATSDFKKLLKSFKEPSKTAEKPRSSFDLKVSKEISKNEFDAAKGKKSNKKIVEKEKIGMKSEKSVEKKAGPQEKYKKNDKIKKIQRTVDSEKKMEDDLLFHPGAFIFKVNSEDSKRNLCGKHSRIYLKNLKQYKIWALMMYDATAKFTSGILQGNINHLGDFDECLAINAVFKNIKNKPKEASGIKGKYCLANIDVTTDSENNNLRIVLERAESFQFIKSTIYDPGHFIPRFTTINWGLCVPSACLAEDVEQFLKSQLEVYSNSTGLHFDVEVDEGNCIVKDNLKFRFEKGTVMAILFYFIVFSISLYATFLDSQIKINEKSVSKKQTIEDEEEEITKDAGTKNEEDAQEALGKANETKISPYERTKDILMAFSLKKNVEKLFSDNSKGAIECVNGIKSIFTIMLYFAHKTIPLGMTPFSNRIFLTKISNQPVTILLRASIIYTDSFLLISGVLTSYNLAKEISEHKKISWVKKLVARFIRLTPALFAVVLFYAYIWNQLGSGPIWNLLVGKNSLLCQKHMWKNLLYIQNLFAFENMCAPQTHQLALDMQLSLLAPLFVHLIHTYDKAGVGILQALFIISSIMRYITASSNELSVVIYHGMSVSQLYKTANLLYGQTIHRASPYILGTIVGYHLRKFEKKIDMPKAFAALGWILSFAFGFYSVVSSSPLAQRTYEYNVHEAAQYAALAPVGWSLALSWLITACHLGYGGILNEFLSQKIFLVFSRISYSVYLTQFLVFFYKVGVKRIPEMFTFAGSVNITEFFLVIAISTTVTLFFDIPMMEIKKIILDKKITVMLEDEVKNIEPEQSQEGSQTEDEEISSEDLPSTTERLSEGTDDEDEYKNEIPNEEIDEESEENSEENISEDSMDDTQAEVKEVFEIRPLKRSTRMHFNDDSESNEFVMVETEEEDEQKEK